MKFISRNKYRFEIYSMGAENDKHSRPSIQSLKDFEPPLHDIFRKKFCFVRRQETKKYNQNVTKYN